MAASLPPIEPRTFGRFTLDAFIGSGAAGRVYSAVDAATGARVALKVLIGLEASDRARFEREARLLQAVDDVHVVQHVAYGTTDAGDPFLAMEWVDGPTLQQRFGGPKLTLVQALTLAASVAAGLAGLDERGIVHRDIKPSNILLPGGDFARAKIADLGIAKAMTGASQLTVTGALLGTPRYMSPEQARGAPALTGAADVYALGGVLFRSLAERTPFDGDAAEILIKLVSEDAPRVSAFAKVPAEIDAWVGSMLHADPARRPSARALAAMLRAWLGLDLAGSAAGPSPAAAPLRRRAISEEGHLVACCVVARGPVDLAELAPPLRARYPDGSIRVDALADGSIVGRVVAPAAPSDQALHALGFASLVASLAPAASVRVAAVRAPRSGVPTLPPGTEAAGVVVEPSIAPLLRGHPAPSPPPFFGRERELEALELHLQALLTPRHPGKAPRAPHAVVVRGEAGIGKTALLDAFLGRARDRGLPHVWLGRGGVATAATPHALVKTLVRAGLGLGLGLDVAAYAPIHAAVAAAVDPAAAARVTEVVAELLGVPAPAPSAALVAARADAGAHAHLLRRGLSELVAALAERSPLVIAVDDVQWVDRASLALLGAALAASGRVLGVLIGRGEAAALEALGAPRVTEIVLGPLSRQASTQLVEGIVPVGPDAAGRVAWVVERAEGHPFVACELARAGARGVIALPLAVAALVEARLRPLGDAANRILRLASALGSSFTRDALVEILGGPRMADGLDAALAALERAGVLCEAAPGREERAFSIRHPIVRDAAYASLAPSDAALTERKVRAHRDRREDAP